MKTTTTNSHMMLRPLALSIALGLSSLAAQAQTAAPTATPAAAQAKRVDIAAMPAAEALQRLVEQTKFQLIYSPDIVRGVTTKAVNGTYTLKEALERMLEGTGLKGVETGVNAATIRLANAGDSKADAAGSIQELQKVEVTGTRLKRIDAEGPVPVNVYRKEDIERSGQPTLERFLSSLNEVSIGAGEGSSSAQNGQGTVQLRGLPLGSTLVLINGRRVQSAGSSQSNFFNLNVIPMAAVERIEVVPVGSSAVYGGDALAGVVNIILKKSLDGIAFDAGLGTGRGLGSHSLSMGLGGQSDLGSFMLLGSYSKSTPLMSNDRDFFMDADYRRFGGVDARARYCTPGTVTSTTGGNLPGLNSSFAAIPTLPSGQPLTISSFAATAGQANLCGSQSNGKGNALIHGSETFGLHAVAQRQLTSTWGVFGELTFARDRLRAEEQGLLMYNLLVPATNPYNPFGVPVRVTSRLSPENGLEDYSRETDFTRAVVGVRGEFGAGWEFEATASITRDAGASIQKNLGAPTASASVQAALAASDPAAALNLFTAGRAASDAVLRAAWPDSVRSFQGRKTQASAFVRGPLLELPAGKVDVIAGAEAARDNYVTLNPASSSYDIKRSSGAAFGEVRVPLWRTDAAGAAEPARELAALTVAGRRDHYSVFGSANTYQAGLELRPSTTTLLRVSSATSFKPPTMLQLAVNDVYLTSESYALTDPLRGNAPVLGGTILRTTNPDLKPESGQAQSVGMVWEPEFSAGTRFGLNAWQVKIDGVIALLWPQTAVDNASLFPGFVTRAPAAGGGPGPITRVLYAEVNIGKLDTAGVDMDISHAWKMDGTKWTVSGSATRTRKYDVVLALGAPVASRLGRRSPGYWSPDWKGRLSAAVEQGAWSLGVTSRYVGSYMDLLPSDRKMGNYWTHDLGATLDLKRAGWGLPYAKEARVSLAITNLSDRQPEYATGSPYFDASQADWRGRYASLRLSTSW